MATSANDHRVYAVFSTPDSDVRMSAVCAFSMKRIREEFDYGTFKQQVSLNAFSPFRICLLTWVLLQRYEFPADSELPLGALQSE